MNTIYSNYYGGGDNPCLYDIGLDANNTVYSDRLWQWDHKKHDQLCEKHFGNTGQRWSVRDPNKIEEFLRDYIGNNELILCKIEEHINKSNGYSLWRFDYFIKKEENDN